MENDMKLQHLLIKDNFLMKLYSKNNLKDKYFEKFVSSCSSIQRQGSILHPLDAFCLIKKYSKIMPKIFKPEHLIDQLMLENQTTEVFDTLPEKTYQQAISALGFLLKHLFLRCYMKNHFSHKGLFGSQTNCFMAHPILSDIKTLKTNIF